MHPTHFYPLLMYLSWLKATLSPVMHVPICLTSIEFSKTSFIDNNFRDMFMLAKCILDYLNHTYTHQDLLLLTLIDENPRMDN